MDGSNGGLDLLAPAGTDGLRILKKAAPATPYSITAAFIPHMVSDAATFPGLGLLFRESGTGELVTWSYTLATDVFARAQKWNSPTSFNAGYVMPWENMTAYLAGPVVWFRITDNGTNLLFSVSNSGHLFHQIFSVSRTDFMAGGPDEVGFWANAVASYETGITILSWEES
jgi:hypothetical protein